MTSHPEVVLTVGGMSLTVDPAAGARATAWTVDGLSLLTRHGSAAVEYGMYPMGPWAGRLRDNRLTYAGRRFDLPRTYGEWAIHGTVYDKPAEVIDLEQGPESARLLARVSDHPAWPWPMHIDIEWHLRERAMTTVLSVHAHADEFPAVVGWHPWFARRLDRGGPLEWSVDAVQQVERGAGHLPTGRLVPFDPSVGPFDDAFVVPSGRARVRWPGALAVDVAADAGWYVVFDELDDAVCLEPQSGPPNGVNDGLGGPIATATPGRPLRLVTTWDVSDDPLGDPA